MNTQPKSYGYYLLSITSPGARQLMHTNNERAFVVSQLQDLLSPRLLIATVPPHKQLASCIDLLAFSITANSIHLLVFAIDKSVLSHIADSLVQRLVQYQSEYHPRSPMLPTEPIVRTKKLRGPHQALASSIELHLFHEDWEYDRYSSIGFYLHDRRGDWMRTWRLAQLYENDSDIYRLLIEGPNKQAHSPAQPRLQSFAA